MLIGKHHTVGIAIENHPQIGFRFHHFLLKLHNVFHIERIGLVVRKTAIRLIEQIFRERAENIFHHDRRHSVAAVHHYFQIADVFFIREHECNIILQKIKTGHISGSSGRCRCFFYFLLELVQTIVISHRNGVGSRNFQAVVFSRIVAGSDHDRRFETEFRRAPIDHRSGAEAGIRYFAAGISESFE
ncbi:hypothetical protein SDC9_56560 [bioreactor metagenome]|uniref:Uncharacterized protein n=1 Tax=bioreactor metagenome TaxID=1076179 RepID=A0A644X250_9ZZZZ